MEDLITLHEFINKISDHDTIKLRNLVEMHYRALISQKLTTDEITLPISSHTDLRAAILCICEHFAIDSLVDPDKILPPIPFLGIKVINFRVESVNGEASYLDIEEVSSPDSADSLSYGSYVYDGPPVEPQSFSSIPSPGTTSIRSTIGTTNQCGCAPCSNSSATSSSAECECAPCSSSRSTSSPLTGICGSYTAAEGHYLGTGA